jgi:hypothetical protein
VNFGYETFCKKCKVDFNLDPTGDNPRSAASKYEREGWTNIFGFSTHFMTGLPDDLKTSDALSMVFISPPENTFPKEYKYVLLQLHDRFKKNSVNVSEVETTLDYMTKSYKYVSDIFNSLRKIFYLSHITRSDQIRPDGFQIIRPTRVDKEGEEEKVKFDLNGVIHYGKRYKIYERGKDEERFSKKYKHLGEIANTPGWNRNDCDRVRFERTLLSHELAKLKKNRKGRYDHFNLLDLAEYKNKTGINILHHILDQYKFKAVKMGPLKGNYNCLLSTFVAMEDKKGYLGNCRIRKAFELKQKMREAVKGYSYEWFN